MTSLQATQQQMLQAVLAESAQIPPIIRGSDLTDARSRLEIYRHGYRVRLRDALQAEFSGLRSMAGARFEVMLDKYISAHPSEHYNIRWYGAGLAAFLDYARPWRDQPQFGDMARLDWAISVAFDAADETSASAADLASVPPDAWPRLQLSLLRNLHVLDCRCNVDAFRRAADHGHPRPRLRRLAPARQILVWRKETTVHYRRLDDTEWQVLSAALRGETLAGLCECLAARHDGAAAMAHMVTLLQGWLSAGLIHGWTFA
ncbi:DNA-binding domain-containing protein [Dyella choica]|uniref:DUF2063 domain-containing protein n=1 Tax=Dyella choica TaxID=1927959 RepID=A0A432M5K1_9GAMM|nr:DNA-binding domain-containing protein [Dyella choica]RUL74831.1 DUF2063 domain-containing protein [Dyella choica]